MKLYGLAKATCTQRVIMLLNELDVPFELCKIDLMKGEHKSPDYIKLQPFGKIPVLCDDDLVLFESRCILRYIAKKYSEKINLYGDNLKEQSLIDNWIEAEGQNYNGPISALIYEKVFKKMMGGGESDESVVEKNLKIFNSVLDVYENVLTTRDYIAGDKFSLADITCIPYSYYLYRFQLNLGMKEDLCPP